MARAVRALELILRPTLGLGRLRFLKNIPDTVVLQRRFARMIARWVLVLARVLRMGPNPMNRGWVFMVSRIRTALIALACSFFARWFL